MGALAKCRCHAQSELAAMLESGKESLSVLSGRWWRKRWSRQSAEAAMEQLLKLLEVGQAGSCMPVRAALPDACLH